MSLHDGIDLTEDDDYDITSYFHKIEEEYAEEYNYYLLYSAIFKRISSDGIKIRITVKADYRERDSYGEVHIFDFNNNKWNDLCTLHHSKMKSAGYYDNSPETKELIYEDVKVLLKKTENIVAK